MALCMDTVCKAYCQITAEEENADGATGEGKGAALPPQLQQILPLPLGTSNLLHHDLRKYSPAAILALFPIGIRVSFARFASLLLKDENM